jgi:MFS family permease
MGATFVDHLGRFLLFPYFSLYITQRFGVGLTEVGVLFLIFSLASMVGSFIGGAISDKFGRKTMLIFGLVTSAVSSLLMATAESLVAFYVIGAFVGLLSNAGGPAQQAMIADLLPEKKRAEGYGMHRVVFNISATLGPAIGGVLASINFLWLFVFDAVSSLITALIVHFVIPETKPESSEEVQDESLTQTVGGYGKILRDAPYMAYVFISILVTIVYVQMNSTMPVYLFDQHGIEPEGYGFLLSMNAAIVVIFQFWVSRRVSGKSPMIVLALGTLLYAIGFGMYGFGSTFAFFIVAMIVITVGEMVVAPVGQALVAQFSPEEMRGRYMAVFGFTWGISFAFGPLLAGYVSDFISPNWVWYGSFILGMIGVLGYLILHARLGEQLGEVESASPPATEAEA